MLRARQHVKLETIISSQGMRPDCFSHKPIICFAAASCTARQPAAFTSHLAIRTHSLQSYQQQAELPGMLSLWPQNLDLGIGGFWCSTATDNWQHMHTSYQQQADRRWSPSATRHQHHLLSMLMRPLSISST